MTTSTGRPRPSRAWRRGGRRRSRCSCRPCSTSLMRGPPLPGPGGPAKACAMSSQRSASGPVGDEVEVVAVAALGDPQAEVVRRAAHRLLRLDRDPTPTARPRVRCSSIRNSSAGGSSECTPKAKLRVRTPRWATCRIRSVGSGSMPERLGDVERVRPGLHEPGRAPSTSGSSAARTTASSRPAG